eukprot:g2284.t1
MGRDSAGVDQAQGQSSIPRLVEPLHAKDCAAHWGCVDTLRALLRHGCDVTATNIDGYTALHHAANNFEEPGCDTSDAVRALLEAGANIEARTLDLGCTPLHLAAGRDQWQSSDTICALLDGGAYVNARQDNERTPLHEACCASSVSAVEILLRRGADETLVDETGDRPADHVGKWGEGDEARKADNQRIRHMLARAPADRSWGRRGWLVLARCHPDKVQIVEDKRGGGRSAKAAKATSGGEGERNAGIEDEPPVLACLVSSVLGLDAEGEFRLIVGFI